MRKREEEVAHRAARTIGSFPYISGTGKCIIMEFGGDRPFTVYLDFVTLALVSKMDRPN